MEDEVRILIADDHPMMRDGLRFNLGKHPGLNVIADAADGEAALALIRKLRPDIAILDVNMPKLDGIALAREIASQRLSVRIIFLTLHEDEGLLRLAMKLGARGYLLKDSAMPEIVAGVRSVMAGHRYVSAAMTSLLLEERSSAPQEPANPLTANLTPTELRILRLIADGESSKEIGAKLSLHYRTVENHRSNICRKLKIDGSNSLLRFALQNKAVIDRLNSKAKETANSH